VDWIESLTRTGFKVENPNLKPLGSEPLEGELPEKVEQVIEQQINPAVASHGGRIHLVDVRDEVVYVKMSGGCQGCGMASVTLTQGIKRMIMEALPEIRDIQDVTDHAAGENPYFG
jgi:Fe/S biogenesis protein NfuA